MMRGVSALLNGADHGGPCWTLMDAANTDLHPERAIFRSLNTELGEVGNIDWTPPNPNEMVRSDSRGAAAGDSMIHTDSACEIVTPTISAGHLAFTPHTYFVPCTQKHAGSVKVAKEQFPIDFGVTILGRSPLPSGDIKIVTDTS